MNEEIKQKHNATLDELYNSWGVGETWEHKYRFWNSYQPHTNIYGATDTKQEVKIFETGWLTDKFPQDFTFC